METGIKIEGTSPNPAGVQALTEAIEKVFRAGAETRMEQDTVQAALTLLSRAGTVNDMSIANSSVHGGKSVHLHVDATSFDDSDA